MGKKSNLLYTHDAAANELHQGLTVTFLPLPTNTVHLSALLSFIMIWVQCFRVSLILFPTFPPETVIL